MVIVKLQSRFAISIWMHRNCMWQNGLRSYWESFVYVGTDGRVTPVFESDQLSRGDLSCWAKKAYKEFYLRPSYLWQRIRGISSVGDLKVNIKGLSMLSRI